MCSQIFFRRSTQFLNASCFFSFIRSRIEVHAIILRGGGLHRRQRQRQSRGRGASGPAQPLTCGRPLHRRSHGGRSADPRHHFGDALRAAGELAVHGGGGVPHLRRRPRPGEGTEGVEGAEGAEGAEGPDSAGGAEGVGESLGAARVEGAERVEGSEGVRGQLDRGVQADSTDLLREKALAQPGPSARMCSPGSDCTVFWQCVVSSAQTKITAPHRQ